MNKKFFLSFLLTPAFYFLNAQTTKFDTTLKMGDVGYRILCSNKKTDRNDVTIRVIGFKDYNHDLNVSVIGTLHKALIDDFNDDGNPDLVFYSFDDNQIAQVYALASVNNKSYGPIYMADIYINPKLREGYQGHDEFSAMGGYLIRKYPIYQTDSTTKTATVIGTRVVEYKAKPNLENPNPDHPTYKFEIFKSYDLKQ